MDQTPGFVFVFILGVCPCIFALACLQFGKVFFKGIGNVFKKDQTQHDLLIFSGINVLRNLSAAFQSCFSSGLSLTSFTALTMRFPDCFIESIKNLEQFIGL
jgi:hypothetical protein